MSKTKSKTPKYVCGDCGIGVKYSAILCTSSCQQWFHGGCVGITDSRLKKLTKEEINSWTCGNCSHISPQSLLPVDTSKEATDTQQIHQSTTKSRSANSLQNTMQDIQEKILNTQVNDLETSLTLAAEVGSALLTENGKLKQDLLNLTLKNSHYEQLIKEQHNTGEAKYLGIIEELEDNKTRLLNRIDSLVETVRELEKQLVKEKELRNELTVTFENHDKLQTEIMKDYEDKLNKQAKTIMSWEARLQKMQRNYDTTKLLTDCGTQADFQQESIPSSSALLHPAQHSNSSLLREIVQLKLRQDQVEKFIKDRDGQTSNSYSRTPKLTQNKLCKISPKRQISLMRVTQTSNYNCTKSDSKKNYLSISLQAKKFRKEIEAATNCPQQERKQLEMAKSKLKSPENKFKVSISPPITATKLDPHVSFQDFFNQHIERIKAEETLPAKQNFPGLTSTPVNTTENYFLEPMKKKNAKWKQKQKTDHSRN